MMPSIHYIRSYPSFPSVIPVHMASSLRVTHPSAMIPSPRRESSHRLACVKHSVSVHPEPGSNSSFNSCYFLLHLILYPFFNIFASSSYVFIVLANSHWQNKYYHTYLHHVNYFFTLFSTFFISLPLSTISPPLSLTNTIYCVVINKKMHLQC